MVMTGAYEPFEELYFTARDGLKLHVRRYPAANSSRGARRPVLCLPGLTRNGRDFHQLALALSQDPTTARDVYTFDYRGRGLSQSDPDFRNYTVPIEMQDVLDFITLADLHGISIVGTSRGGLISMLMAAVQPTSIGPVVLNDIGPIVEQKGIGRIAAYVGRIPLPGTWDEAAKIVQEMAGKSFPGVTPGEWLQIARQLFNERKGKPAPGYDANLAKAFSVLDGPIPPLWPQFEALKRVPVLVLRGQLSDILTQETVDEMRRRHPTLTAMTIAGQGHAPLLRDTTSIEAIGRFLASTEAGTDRSSVQYAYA
jgi:pimeloyl-ACP methyl ester carboxylesterase